MHEVAPERFTSLNMYNIDLVQKEKLDILTICSVCNYSLKLAAQKGNLEDQKITSLEELVILEMGLDNLKNLLTNSLKGMKVAPFYGCKSLRPAEFNQLRISNGPDYLKEVISSLGATPISYPYETKCCGFPDLYVDKDSAVKITDQVLNSANDNGAEYMLTPCPLCQLTLDVYHSKNLKIPVLHFSQFLGLALGIPWKELGLNMNVTSTKSLRA